MNLSISTAGPHCSPRWSQVRHHFSEWRSRVRSRHELLNLSGLRDTGVLRCDAVSKHPGRFGWRDRSRMLVKQL